MEGDHEALKQLQEARKLELSAAASKSRSVKLSGQTRKPSASSAGLFTEVQDFVEHDPAGVATACNQAYSIETRVAKARSASHATIEKRANELAESAVDAFFAEKIDELELKRRKADARDEAIVEQHDALKLLDGATDAYAAATATRIAAEKAEEEAASKVDEVLRTIEAHGWKTA